MRTRGAVDPEVAGHHRIKTAKEYATELRALYRRHGSLDPETVVAWAAAHPESALHGRFLWDDTKAAHQYRLWQARALITDVTVVHADGRVRQEFVSPVESRGEGGYQALVEVLDDAAKRALFLRQALEEFQRVSDKYADLEEFAAVRAALAKVR